MKRITCKCHLLPACNNVFTVKGQINVFGIYKKRIQKMLHKDSSFALFIYSETLFVFESPGRQCTAIEQALQDFEALHFGV